MRTEVTGRREDEVSGYWMTLRIREDKEIERGTTRSHIWRTRFGRGNEPVVRQTTEWMNEWMSASKSIQPIGLTPSMTFHLQG
jgi:hypothetical protein